MMTAKQQLCMYAYVMDQAVDNFFNNSFAFDKLSFSVNLIFYVLKIPAY